MNRSSAHEIDVFRFSGFMSYGVMVSMAEIPVNGVINGGCLPCSRMSMNLTRGMLWVGESRLDVSRPCSTALHVTQRLKRPWRIWDRALEKLANSEV